MQLSGLACKATDDGGTHYLKVASAGSHNFTVCAGATPFTGTLDDLFAPPHSMDRRCILGDAAVAQYQAIIAVYNDTVKSDLTAAHAFCDANGGTNS